MPISNWKIAIFSLIIALITGILIFIIISLFKVYFKKTKYYFSGFVIFNIDTKNQRVRINNDIQPLTYFPPFLYKNTITNGEWFQINIFTSIFDEKTRKILNNVFINDLNNESVLYFDLFLKNSDGHKYKLILEKNKNDYFVATVYWNKKDYDYIDKNIVFKNINTKNDVLPFLNKNATSIVINIKKTYIYKQDYLINELSKLISYKRYKKFNLSISNSKIFIWYENDKNNSKENNKCLKYQEILLKNISILKQYFDLFIIADSSFLDSLTLGNINLYFYYLINVFKNNKYLLKNKILNTTFFQTNKSFNKFEQIYSEAILLANNEEYNLLKTTINDLNKNIITKKTIISPRFSNINKENQFKKILGNTDIFDYLWLTFFKSIRNHLANNSIILINDYIFNLLSDSYLITISKEYQNLNFIINITNYDNLKFIKNKLEYLISKDCEFGLKINNLNIEEIMMITKEINIKYILINELICKNLNNLKNYLYISTFLEKIKDKNINIIFESLDVENYKKLINNKIDRIYYTITNTNTKQI